MKQLALLALLVSFSSMAHEGHGLPGALPPAPHGGMVKEAEHAGKDVHNEGKPEVELFFEVVYKDQEVTIYPLTFGPNAKAFVSLSPAKSLKNISLKAEVPKTKKVEKLTATVSDDSIKAKFNAGNVNRFLIHVSAEQDSEVKTAKLQIEKK